MTQTASGVTDQSQDQQSTLTFAVDGMTCGSCAARVQKVLGKQPGADEAEVNFASGQARVLAGPDVDVEQLRSAVTKIGYTLR